MSTYLRSPVSWFGGKGQVLHQLVPLIPPHHIYVEVFGGAAHLLMAKPPAPVEVYNDLDSGLVNFFRVLRDPLKFDQLQRLVLLTTWSREEWQACRATWAETPDDVERAYRWYVVARQSFSGQFGNSWASTVQSSRQGMAATASKWLSGIERLPAIHARLLRTQVEHRDWPLIFDRYDSPETFFYCDPPYIAATRRRGGYAHEMSDADHAALVARLGTVQGKVLRSGYDHPLYAPLEAAGWERRTFAAWCYSHAATPADSPARPGQRRTESVWMNYSLFARVALAASATPLFPDEVAR